MLSAQPWHQDVSIKHPIPVCSRYTKAFSCCWNDDLHLALTLIEKRGWKISKKFMSVSSDCIIPHKNIPYSPSMPLDTRAFEMKASFYIKGHINSILQPDFIDGQKSWCSVLRENVQGNSNAHWGSIQMDSSPSSRPRKYIIWSGIIQLELCFFLINLKSYVSEGLHNLWYEMN